MRRWTGISLLSLALIGAVLLGTREAQSDPAPAPGASNVPAQKPAPSDNSGAGRKAAALDCTNPASEEQVLRPTTKLYLEFANSRIWGPFDGKFQFKIVAPDATTTATLDDLPVAVCFGWPKKWFPNPEEQSATFKNATPPMVQSYDVRVVKRDGNTAIVYEVSLPPDVWDPNVKGGAKTVTPDIWRDWISFFQGRPYNRYSGWGFVPILNMRVVAQAKDDKSRLDSILPLGITYHSLALLVSLLSVAVFWFALWKWGQARKVRGGVLLKIIANRNNYASLSQFQILLWTFVIGAGAIYVMSLTGGLIDIPQQALILLGISGASALTAAIAPPKDSTTVAAAAATPTTVGIVNDLRQLSASDTSVVLFWAPPSGGRPVASYKVSQWNAAATPPAWAATNAAVNSDPFAVVAGLASGQTYRFRVTACDENGVEGPGAEVNAATAAAPGPLIVGAAAVPPTQLKITIAETSPVAVLAWTSKTTPRPDKWIIQYRVSGGGAWTTVAVPVNGDASAYEIDTLKYMTSYDFQLLPVLQGTLGQPVAGCATTGMRTPRWSDLVIWDGIKEVDITRVQMLAFTVLAAGFVVLKIGTDGDIPVIPDGIIALIGLSNGVYVGAKFITGQK